MDNRMTGIVASNLSPLPRSHWATVSIPRGIAARFGTEATFKAFDGRTFRAVRGSSKGTKTHYRIFFDLMGGGETIRGELVPMPYGKDNLPFEMHEWASDDVNALIASLGVRIERDGHTSDIWTDAFDKLSCIEKSGAHQRWHYQRRIPGTGVIFSVFADMLHRDPVVKVWGKITWSDRDDQRPVARFQHFAIRTGEALALDFGTRNGVLPPLIDLQDGGYVTVLNSAPIDLQDGACLTFSGSLLSFLSPHSQQAQTIADLNPDDLDSLRAAQHGPIKAVCTNWEGNFLANLNIPRLSDLFNQRLVDATWLSFAQLMEMPSNWFANRPIGISKTPGQTGNQEDFGACKGTLAVTMHDPRFIYMLQYAAQSDGFRGLDHYEADGSVLRADRHPDWVTWNLETHYNMGVSRDRLGKAAYISGGTGYHGYDDQHYSMNNIAAYMALEDDPVMESHIEHMAEANLAAYRVKYPTYGYGAARAQGRTCASLAQLSTVVDAETSRTLMRSLNARLAALTSNPDLDKRIAAASWGGPDGRKNVYQDGNRASWMCMWEHGLWMVGLYKVLKLTKSEALRAAMVKVANTMAEFGFFKEHDTWFTVEDLAYNNGELFHGALSSTNEQVASGQGIGGTKSWTFAGLLACRELLGPESQWHSKLSDYINHFTGGMEASTLTDAEWWATVRSVL